MRICSIHIRDMYRFVSPYMIRYLKECQYYSSSFSVVGSVSLSPISLSCSRTSPCSSSVLGGGTVRLLPLQSHPLSSSVTFNQSIHECAIYTVKPILATSLTPVGVRFKSMVWIQIFQGLSSTHIHFLTRITFSLVCLIFQRVYIYSLCLYHSNYGFGHSLCNKKKFSMLNMLAFCWVFSSSLSQSVTDVTLFLP